MGPLLSRLRVVIKYRKLVDLLIAIFDGDNKGNCYHDDKEMKSRYCIIPSNFFLLSMFSYEKHG